MTKPAVTITEIQITPDVESNPTTFNKPALWRGDVKIQIELGIPAKQATFLVYDEQHEIHVFFPSSKVLRTLLRSRPKAYFKAVLLGNGNLDILQEVPERDW